MTQAAREARGETEPATDATLAAAACAGEVRAFEELARRHQDRLLRFLLQRTRSRADAEDALQNALLKAYRYIGQYDPRWAFATWLFTIASRELTSIRRRDRRMVSLDEDVAGALGQAGGDDGDGRIETPGELWELARRVLTEEQYAVLWLTYGEEMPGAQAARVLRRSRVWVRVTVFRARGALRKALEEQERRGGRSTGMNDRPDETGGGVR